MSTRLFTAATVALLLLLPANLEARGSIRRSSSARNQFMWMTGHPRGWPGHIVDHVIPLWVGGPDTPDNMQWQTIQEAKAKNRWEGRDLLFLVLAPRAALRFAQPQHFEK